MHNSDQKISLQSGFVLVERPRGFEISLADQGEMLLELARYCDQADCRKVLVLGEETKVGLGPLDIYALGKEIANHHLQIAVVESHDASGEDVRFLETVASNRGGPIRFFRDQVEAKDWLHVARDS
jgi:hypothetical protein